MATVAERIDLSAQAFWEQSVEERLAAFAVLRRESPVSRHRQMESTLLPPEEGTGGYWAAVTYADVHEVSRDPKRFCSGKGVMFDDAPEELLEASQSFLAMDAPRHTKLRGLVHAAFTPKQVRRIEEQIVGHAKAIVDDLVETGDCDFDAHVARRMPMMTLWDMYDLPQGDREALSNAANDLVGWNDPEVLRGREPIEAQFEGLMTLTTAALELAEARAAKPGEDLMSALVEAEVDGERLSESEIAAFFVLLAVAGNDTTRHTTSHGLKALTDHPEQRAALLADPEESVAGAVEEFIRWATPVMTFRRTATQDTELSGQAIAAGDKVVLFYTSANRDEQAFDEPGRFDIAREPNRHLGFGGGGPHYCLGAPLARMQLRSLFLELLARVPEIEAGEPTPLVGNFINGIKRIPCTLNA